MRVDLIRLSVVLYDEKMIICSFFVIILRKRRPTSKHFMGQRTIDRIPDL